GPATSAVVALEAGIDVELPNPECYGPPLVEAVRAGRVAEATVDRSVRRVLAQKIALGLLEQPYVDEADVDLDPPSHRALAREVAERSIVLLRNEGGLLPLVADVSTIAVIGPNADSGPALL